MGSTTAPSCSRTPKTTATKTNTARTTALDILKRRLQTTLDLYPEATECYNGIKEILGSEIIADIADNYALATTTKRDDVDHDNNTNNTTTFIATTSNNNNNNSTTATTTNHTTVLLTDFASDKTIKTLTLLVGAFIISVVLTIFQRRHRRCHCSNRYCSCCKNNTYTIQEVGQNKEDVKSSCNKYAYDKLHNIIDDDHDYDI